MAGTDAAVVLWGAKSSGKSGFLGALWHVDQELTEAPSTWAISPGDVADAYSSDYLRIARADLEAGRRNATAPSASYQPVRVTARRWQNGTPGAQLPLAFRDTAGEFADDAVRARDNSGALLDDMLDAAGIIWLFDGASGVPPKIAEITRHVGSVRQKNGGRPVTTPVAFCVSKIDQLPPAERAHAIANPRDAVVRAASPAVMELLETTFLNRKYFAISARGDQPGVIQPIGQNAVLDWIHGEYRRRETGAFVAKHRKAMVITAVATLVIAAAAVATYRYYNGEGAVQRRIAEEQALGRLELAGQAYRSGQLDSVVALLGPPELPRRHPRAADWDTLLAFAAYDVGFQRKLTGEGGDSLIGVALDRAGRALRTVKETQAAARIRYKHAEACISSACGMSTVRKDLNFVIENASDDELVKRARNRLEAARNDN